MKGNKKLPESGVTARPSTYWNYRVIESEDVFRIHEVYYNSKGEITGFSENPITPLGDTLEELKGDLKYYLQALDRPVLKIEEIVFAEMNGPEEQTSMRKGRKR
jgi:hypothetical protein